MNDPTWQPGLGPRLANTLDLEAMEQRIKADVAKALREAEAKFRGKEPRPHENPWSCAIAADLLSPSPKPAVELLTAHDIEGLSRRSWYTGTQERFYNTMEAIHDGKAKIILDGEGA